MNEWKNWVLDQVELVKEKNSVLFSQYPQHQGQCLPNKCSWVKSHFSNRTVSTHKHFTITHPNITDLKIRLIPVEVGKHRVMSMEEVVGEKAQT